ncbi:MAG: helix-turn-helix domain-containing protein [Candidatus Dormibacteria bacterium]|jgi:predicted transcriptional regulator
MTAARIWSPTTEAFDGGLLRIAILERGWTLAEFAEATRLTETTVYAAVRGRAVQDRTAIRILQTLAQREPVRIAS